MIIIPGIKTVAGDCPVITKSRAEVECEWDGIIKALNGNFLHSLAWSRFMAGPNEKTAFFQIQRSGHTVAAGWYVLVEKTVGPIPIVKRLQLESLPCYDPEKISALEVFQEVCALAKREKCLSFDFGNSSEEYEIPDLNGPLQEKFSFDIDLQKPLEEIYANLDTKHQKKIQKADCSALQIKCITGSDAYDMIPELEGLFDYSYRRHRAVGKERIRLESGIVSDVIQDLVLTGNAVIFVALYNAVPVSCYIVSTFNRKASNIYGGSNAMGYELNASFLLIWRIIEYLKENGYRVLNLGAVPASSINETDRDYGLFRHKKGFGAQISVLRNGTVILQPIQHTVLLAVAKWKSALKSCLLVLR